jgi:hypothetical protein
MRNNFVQILRFSLSDLDLHVPFGSWSIAEGNLVMNGIYVKCGCLRDVGCEVHSF